MSMNGDDVDVSSKLNTIEQKSTQFSEVAKELDVRNCFYIFKETFFL